MSFFSKVWKGIKKTFKKIGKGIKSAFKKFGKFMGKIGIVGQIAMMFILPGIGNAMMSTFGSMLQGLGTLGKVGQAAQTILGAAGNFARLVAKPFTTVTDAVGSFISNTSKYIANKIPGMNNLLNRVGIKVTDAPTDFFGLGENSVLGRVGTGISNNVQGFVDIGRDLMTGNLQPFGVGIPKAQPMTIETDALGQETLVNPNMSPVDSTSTRDLLTGPASDPLPQSPSLLGDARTVEVAGAKQTLGQKFRDTFTLENVASTGIDKSFDALVSTGTAMVLDPILGEDPPEEPMGIAYTPQFERDYSGLTEEPLRADTFADYTQRITTGFDDRGLVSSGGAWNNWMRSNLPAYS